MFQTLLQQSPTGQTYALFFLEAITTTILVSLLAIVFATFIAFFISSLRHAGFRLAGAFVEIFRNIPLIVQVFFCYYVLPTLFTPLLKLSNDNQIYFLGLVALTLYSSSRIASQLLSTLNSIPKGQLEACKTLKLTMSQAYRFVMLPVAFRNALPTLANEWAAVIKNSSVISTIGLFELVKSSQVFIEYTSEAFLAFGIVCAVYLAIIAALSIGVEALGRKIKIRGNL